MAVPSAGAARLRVRQRAAATQWSLGRWWVPALVVLTLVVTARLLGTADRIIPPTDDLRVSAGVTDRSFADFRDTVWLPVRDVVHGGNPYDAPAYLQRHPYAFEFTYAPAQLTLFAPLALPPLSTASLIWFWLLVAGAAGLALLTVLLARLPKRADLAVLLTAVILQLAPMADLINRGQTSIVSILGTVVALSRRRTDLITTVAVAAAWLKPQFGVPVAVLLVCWGRWRPAAWGSALVAAVSLPAVAWASINAGGFAQFLGSLPKAVQAALNSPSTRPSDGRVNPDLGSLVGHFFPHWSAGTAILITGAMTLALGSALVYRVRSEGTQQHLLLALALLTVLICLPHFEYDLVLAVPVLALVLSVIAGPMPTTVRAVLWTATLALALLLLPFGRPSPSEREVQLTLLVTVVASGLLASLERGTTVRRVTTALALAALTILLRYGVNHSLSQQINSGLFNAFMLLAAWALLAAGAFLLARSATPVHGRAAPVEPGRAPAA